MCAISANATLARKNDRSGNRLSGRAVGNKKQAAFSFVTPCLSRSGQSPGNCDDLTNHLSILMIAELERGSEVRRIGMHDEVLILRAAARREVSPVPEQQHINRLLPIWF